MKVTNILMATETQLSGKWHRIGDSVIADETCNRIDSLVKTHLIELARADGGWSTLYRDPNDGRLWEHTFTQSEMHGGGPPTLRLVESAFAIAKYGKDS